jgi:hypothetical protein
MPAPSGPPRLFAHPLQYVTHLITPYSEFERAGLERANWFKTTQRGYHDEQATKPQTLAYSLSDSPSGLLAWIYEKLVLWSDDYKWADDEGICLLLALCLVRRLTPYHAVVLTWISIYWFSRAGPAASLRIYFERRAATAALDSLPFPTIPLGISYFPKELFPCPRTCASYLSPHQSTVYLTRGQVVSYLRAGRL